MVSWLQELGLMRMADDYRNREERDGRPVEACRVRSESSTLARVKGQYPATDERIGKRTGSTHLGRDAPAPVVAVAVAVAVEYALRSSLLSFLADFALG
jgi:hypothetical protein